MTSAELRSFGTVEISDKTENLPDGMTCVSLDDAGTVDGTPINLIRRGRSRDASGSRCAWANALPTQLEFRVDPALIGVSGLWDEHDSPGDQTLAGQPLAVVDEPSSGAV